MSIVRGPRPENNWYLLDKRISEDDRLSWAARGLLIYLLGKPDNWRVSVEHLRQQTNTARIRTGRNGVYALLQELAAAGYVEHRRSRADSGQLGGVEYVVREKPHPSDRDEAPHPSEPHPSEPHPADRTLTRIERAPRIEQPPRNEQAKANALARTFGLSRDQARDLVIQRRTDAKRDQAEADAQWARENVPPQPSTMGGMA